MRATADLSFADFDPTFARPKRCVMSNSQNQLGITKKKHLTGNQRAKLRQAQASKLGISANALLKERHARMNEWQNERELLIKSRCPNCNGYGHSFKWCPFANDFELQRKLRFRGPNGQWGAAEPPLQLTQEEKQKSKKHFVLLSMPIHSHSKQTATAMTSLDIQDKPACQARNQGDLFQRSSDVHLQ